MSGGTLTNIYLDLPRNEIVDGESFWSEGLGNDLYILLNTPFYAYGLNSYDIVLAKTQFEAMRPSILSVHEYGGHKTLRATFLDESSPVERASRLTQLNKFNAYHESANGTLFAIGVEPKGDYGAVCDVLSNWEAEGVLSYETCEAKEGFGFDAK